MKFGKLYEDFKKLNPWLVESTELVLERLEKLMEEEGKAKDGEKSQRLVLELFQKVTVMLANFPPDDTFFTDPKPFLYDLSIWLVVTHSHKKIRVKAEYRLHEHRCLITDWVVK